MDAVVERIGVAGAAGAGKTTVANYLVENYGFQILGFATPLYKLGDIHRFPKEEWHSRIWGWTDDYLAPLGYNERDRFHFTDQAWRVMESEPVMETKNRSLLQLLGTEVGRALDENLWTNIFEAKVEELGEGARIVNDNLRFPNEFDSLEKLNFTTIYLETPTDIRATRYAIEYGKPMNQAQLSHASEAYLDEIRNRCNIVYYNTDDVNNLYAFLDKIVTKSYMTV